MSSSVNAKDIHSAINEEPDPDDPFKAWRDLAYYATNVALTDNDPQKAAVIATIARGKLTEIISHGALEVLAEIRNELDQFTP